MGGLKALRPFRGEPLVVNALAQARRWSDDVVVSVRDAAQLAGAVEAPLILDRADVPGPLAGLAAALQHARSVGAQFVLTIPCDMPRLPVDLAETLAAALTADDGVALPEVEGFLQPVCGLWRPRVLGGLTDYLAAGRRSLKGFAETCGLTAVAFADAAAFAGANTPEELAALERKDP